MSGEMNKVTDELLARYLAGEATETEQQLVQQWRAASEDNNKLYYHFKLVWEESLNLAAVSNVNEQAAWERFRERTSNASRENKRVLPSPYRWVKIAAILLLLAGVGYMAYYFNDGNETQTVAGGTTEKVINTTDTPEEQTTTPAPPVATVQPTEGHVSANGGSTVAAPRLVAESKPSLMRDLPASPIHMNYHRTREFICNATPCPIEICIIQTITCPGVAASAYATCSVLEPDESGQLRYKAFDKIKKNCSVAVDEIRIKQVNTGETIVLNDHSQPATAKDFFSYITGQKKGDIQAGTFNACCNSDDDQCGLTFDNTFGHLKME